MVTMVRRLAAQKHSVTLAQRASRISAIMKFSVGADDDPFTMHVDRIVAVVLISTPMAARLFTTMQRTVNLAAHVNRSGQEHVTD